MTDCNDEYAHRERLALLAAALDALDAKNAEIERLRGINESALQACQIVIAAVHEGHDNVPDLILHLIEAVEPARNALKEGTERDHTLARMASAYEAAARDCETMANQSADMALTGPSEQARSREGMDAAFTRAACRIRALTPALVVPIRPECFQIL